jgi:hypothetical protein
VIREVNNFLGYLTALSVSGLYTVDDRVSNKYEAVGVMKISTLVSLRKRKLGL